MKDTDHCENMALHEPAEAWVNASESPAAARSPDALEHDRRGGTGRAPLTDAELVAKGWVDMQPAAGPGENGDIAVRAVIARLVAEFGLPPASVARAIWSWNAECTAPWTRFEIEQFAAVAQFPPAAGAEATRGARPDGVPIEPVLPALRDARPTLSDQVRPMTDLGNAERFVELFSNYARFIENRGVWRCWCSTHWRVDESGDVQRAAAYTARQIAAEAEHLSDTPTLDFKGNLQKSPRKQMQAWGQRSEAAERQQAIVRMGSNRLPISCTAADFDRDPYVLCTPTGIVHLRRDLAVAPCAPEAMLAQCTRARCLPDACSPLWDSFVAQIFQGDAELAAYVQRAVGMSLLGIQRDHVFFFCWGSGSNGKSTLLNAVLYGLGDYGATLPPNLLIAKRNEAHPTELADLEGTRMAVGAEVPQGATWDEVRIKSLTGGDNIKARTMHKDFFEFKPSHTFWMSGNSKPNIMGTDAGIWRRVRLVPFLAQIKPDQMDRDLPEKLKQPEHMDAILAWCLQGARDYLRHGLGTCSAVELATQGYREDEDLFGQFLAECCVVESICSVEKSAMRKAMKEWFEERDYPTPSEKVVKAEFAARSIVANQPHRGQRRWSGVGLQQAAQDRGSNWQNGDTRD